MSAMLSILKPRKFVALQKFIYKVNITQKHNSVDWDTPENDKSSYLSLLLIKNQIESKWQNNNYKITGLEPIRNNSEPIALVIKFKISWN